MSCDLRKLFKPCVTPDLQLDMMDQDEAGQAGKATSRCVFLENTIKAEPDGSLTNNGASTTISGSNKINKGQLNSSSKVKCHISSIWARRCGTRPAKPSGGGAASDIDSSRPGGQKNRPRRNGGRGKGREHT